MEIKGINVLKNITLYRGKRPSNLSSYIETNRNSSNLPYPIQSDISNGLLNTSKRFFKQDMGFKFNISKKGDLFISASCDIGNVVILDEDEAFIDDKFIKFSPNENIKINYLKYWLVKNKKEIMKLGYGTTFQMLYLQQLNNFLKDQYLPSLLTQQSIIDIIEPYEALFLKYINLVRIDTYQNCLSDMKIIIDIIEPFELKLKQIKNKLTYIKNITNRIINYDYKVINLFKDEEILFSKGINFKKGMISEKKTDLLFINVAAINNNPNKYINKEFSNLKNVQIGDVILSLDGNTGLVNNFLTGINGYGYKIISNKYSNFQLYYSLLAKINQDIIKQNSHGTTIQHASKAKDRILLLDFNKSNLLELFYELDIKYKQIYETLTKIINLLIEKYVH